MLCLAALAIIRLVSGQYRPTDHLRAPYSCCTSIGVFRGQHFKYRTFAPRVVNVMLLLQGTLPVLHWCCWHVHCTLHTVALLYILMHACHMSRRVRAQGRWWMCIITDPWVLLNVRLCCSIPARLTAQRHPRSPPAPVVLQGTAARWDAHRRAEADLAVQQALSNWRQLQSRQQHAVTKAQMQHPQQH